MLPLPPNPEWVAYSGWTFSGFTQRSSFRKPRYAQRSDSGTFNSCIAML